MNKPLLSVIIPVYNMEDYIVECLNSIVNQTYLNLEIIIINDGSQDGSLNIIKKYAIKDSRIVVIDKENEGLSSARNAGLDVMTGDLVTFVDADDKIEIDIYEKNIPIFENDNEVNMVQFPIHRNWQSSDSYIFNPGNYSIIGPENVFMAFFDQSEKMKIPYEVWSKIFRSEIFKLVRFKDGLIYEDVYLASQIWKHINKVTFSDQSCYRYRLRIGSLINSPDNKKKKLDLIFVNMALLKQAGLVQKITEEERLLFFIRRIYWITIRTHYHCTNEERNSLFRELKLFRFRTSAAYQLFRQKRYLSIKEHILICIYPIFKNKGAYFLFSRLLKYKFE